MNCSNIIIHLDTLLYLARVTLNSTVVNNSNSNSSSFLFLFLGEATALVGGFILHKFLISNRHYYVIEY